MNRKFSIGDRVRFIDNGDIGTIICIPDFFGVEFDNERIGIYHSLSGKCKNGHGYWLSVNDIVHLDIEENYIPYEDRVI